MSYGWNKTRELLQKHGLTQTEEDETQVPETVAKRLAKKDKVGRLRASSTDPTTALLIPLLRDIMSQETKSYKQRMLYYRRALKAAKGEDL